MGQSLRVGGSYVAVTILIPPTNPPFHLSRARALKRQQEGDQGERASRLGWERGEGAAGEGRQRCSTGRVRERAEGMGKMMQQDFRERFVVTSPDNISPIMFPSFRY
jgi:hypothetical protein